MRQWKVVMKHKVTEKEIATIFFAEDEANEAKKRAEKEDKKDAE